MNRILTCYYIHKPGGYCRRLLQAMNALLESGYEVHYLSVSPFPLAHENCIFHRFPWPFKRVDGLFFWACFHMLAPFLLTYIGIRNKVSHAFAFGSNYIVFMQPLRILKRIPLVFFMRGDPISKHIISGRPRWLIRIEMFLEGLALPGVRVVANSKALLDTLLSRHRFFNPISTDVLRNNIDSLKIKLTHSVRLPVRLACVGMLEKTKNQSLIIEALSRCNNVSYHLRIYGSGEDEMQLKNMVNVKGLAETVTFMGWVDDMQQQWPEIDLLVSASLYEGSPNSVLEAMGNDVPVLVSDIPAHTEILGEKNIVSNSSIDAWVERLGDLLASPELRLDALRIAQSGYAEKIAFDWDEKFLQCLLSREK